MGKFKIDADNFVWINGDEDDPEDLCLHGHVTLQIGDTVIEDTVTVSAAALNLLKSVTEDHVSNDPGGIQMLPCCGHFLIANEDLTNVTILGCNMGTDWTVTHEDGYVKHLLPDGREERVELEVYTDRKCLTSQIK